MPIAKLGHMTSIGTLLAFVIVCIGIIWMRKTIPMHRGRFARHWFRWCRFSACFRNDVHARLDNWTRLIVWLVIGLTMYFTYGVKNSHLAKDNAATGVR